MDFQNLHGDCNCDCTKDTQEDTFSIYAIKTPKDKLRKNDFKSYWEKGKGEGIVDCEKICSLKGNSVSKITDETKEEVKKVFQQLFKLAPGYKPYFTLIKFKADCGVLKYTPDEINQHHYDFYKCDTFDFSEIEFINSTVLHPENV